MTAFIDPCIVPSSGTRQFHYFSLHDDSGMSISSYHASLPKSKIGN